MPFTPKDWQNAPSTATPIGEADLEDLEIRVTDYADLVAGSNVTNITKAPYNADPTGTADCAAGITQAILDAAAGTTPKTLYAPQGTYRLNSALPWRSGVRLIGDGMWGKTVFKPTGQDPTTTPGLRFISWDTSNATSTASPLTNLDFRDFEVDGSAVTAPPSGVPTSDGFHFQHVRNARFQNLYVHDCGQTGFDVQFCYESVTFTNCYAKVNGRLNSGAQAGGNGFGLSSHGANDLREPVTVLGCHAVDNKRYGFLIEASGTTSSGQFAHGARIQGNWASGGQVGIGDAGNRRTLISGNTVTNASIAGISVDNGTSAGMPGLDGLINGNLIYSCTGDGIALDFTNQIYTGNSGRWTITNNDVQFCTLNGIVLRFNGFEIWGVKISNNQIHDNGRCGIRAYYPSTVAGSLRWGEITSNQVSTNGTSNTANEQAGIQIDVAATNVRIDDNSCFDRNTTKFQAIGLVLSQTFTGGSIRNNDLRNNRDSGWGGALNIGGTTAVGSNLGILDGAVPVNPHPPVLNEVVGASPWTRTQRNYPEFLNLFGGTVSNVTINGTPVSFSTNCSIFLEAGDVLVITWSVIPTLRVRRRS